MNRRLTLKKTTIKDMDESAARKVAGGGDSEFGTCDFTCPVTCDYTCEATCPETCAGNFTCNHTACEYFTCGCQWTHTCVTG